jgi:hypothetical protein
MMKKRQVAAEDFEDDADEVFEQAEQQTQVASQTPVADASINLDRITAKRSQLRDIIAGIFSGNPEIELVSTARCRYALKVIYETRVLIRAHL